MCTARNTFCHSQRERFLVRLITLMSFVQAIIFPPASGFSFFDLANILPARLSVLPIDHPAAALSSNAWIVPCCQQAENHDRDRKYSKSNPRCRDQWFQAGDQQLIWKLLEHLIKQILKSLWLGVATPLTALQVTALLRRWGLFLRIHRPLLPAVPDRGAEERADIAFGVRLADKSHDRWHRMVGVDYCQRRTIMRFELMHPLRYYRLTKAVTHHMNTVTEKSRWKLQMTYMARIWHYLDFQPSKKNEEHLLYIMKTLNDQRRQDIARITESRWQYLALWHSLLLLVHTICCMNWHCCI